MPFQFFFFFLVSLIFFSKKASIVFLKLSIHFFIYFHFSLLLRIINFTRPPEKLNFITAFPHVVLIRDEKKGG